MSWRKPNKYACPLFRRETVSLFLWSPKQTSPSFRWKYYLQLLRLLQSCSLCTQPWKDGLEKRIVSALLIRHEETGDSWRTVPPYWWWLKPLYAFDMNHFPQLEIESWILSYIEFFNFFGNRNPNILTIHVVFRMLLIVINT